MSAADVVRPKHYRLDARHDDGTPIEPWDITALLGCHCTGSAIDYVMRAGRKPGADWREDLDKARGWLGKLIEVRQRSNFPDWPIIRGPSLSALQIANDLILRVIRAAPDDARSIALDRLFDVARMPRDFLHIDRALDAIALLWLDLENAERLAAEQSEASDGR